MKTCFRATRTLSRRKRSCCCKFPTCSITAFENTRSKKLSANGILRPSPGTNSRPGYAFSSHQASSLDNTVIFLWLANFLRKITVFILFIRCYSDIKNSSYIFHIYIQQIFIQSFSSVNNYSIYETQTCLYIDWFNKYPSISIRNCNNGRCYSLI